VRRSKVVHGTKTTAQAELTRMLNLAGQGVVEADRLTVGELIDKVLDVKQMGDGTRQDWNRVIGSYIRPQLGSTTVAKLTGHRLDAHYAALRTDGVSESRILKAHEILSVVCNQAVAWRWISRSPVPDATRPRKPAKRDRAHNEAVVTALSIAAYGSKTWGPWFHLASTVGPRRGELAVVQCADVDLDAAEFHLSKAAIVIDEIGVVVKRTKTEEDRKVPLDADAVEMFRARKLAQREKLIAAGRPWTDQLYVMTHRNSPFGDEPIRPDAATHWFIRLRNDVAERYPAASPCAWAISGTSP
jgi:hypothetical protein